MILHSAQHWEKRILCGCLGYVDAPRYQAVYVFPPDPRKVIRQRSRLKYFKLFVVNYFLTGAFYAFQFTFAMSLLLSITICVVAGIAVTVALRKHAQGSCSAEEPPSLNYDVSCTLIMVYRGLTLMPKFDGCVPRISVHVRDVAALVDNFMRCGRHRGDSRAAEACTRFVFG